MNSVVFAAAAMRIATLPVGVAHLRAVHRCWIVVATGQFGGIGGEKPWMLVASHRWGCRSVLLRGAQVCAQALRAEHAPCSAPLALYECGLEIVEMRCVFSPEN